MASEFMMIKDTSWDYTPDIFETNFGNDAGWSRGTAESGTSFVDVPAGFTAIKLGTANQRMEVNAGNGRNGTPALRVLYGNEDNKGIYLAKHLTGNATTGYRELYIQYTLKFDPDYLWSDAGDTALVAKQWRLWQGRSTDNAGSDWTENNNEDTYYVVNTFTAAASTQLRHKIRANADDDLGSSTGSFPSVGYDWEANGGVYLDNSISEWDIQLSGANQGRWVDYPGGSQSYHTIQYHLKYNSTVANTTQDGILEYWIDGVNHTSDDSTCNSDNDGGTSGWSGGLCTHGDEAPGGANLFLFMENNQGVQVGTNRNWGSHGAHWIDVDQIVISTTQIPHDYIASPA